MHETPESFDVGRLLRPGGELLQEPPAAPTSTWSSVPWRTIVASTLIVLGTIIAVEAILLTTQLITWVVVAGFFAVVLAPAVRRVQDRIGGRRGIATAIVVFGTLASVLGILTVFLMPVRTQLIGIITDLPGTIKDAGSGHGTVGRIVSVMKARIRFQSAEYSPW